MGQAARASSTASSWRSVAGPGRGEVGAPGGYDYAERRLGLNVGGKHGLVTYTGQVHGRWWESP